MNLRSFLLYRLSPFGSEKQEFLPMVVEQDSGQTDTSDWVTINRSKRPKVDNSADSSPVEEGEIRVNENDQTEVKLSRKEVKPESHQKENENQSGVIVGRQQDQNRSLGGRGSQSLRGGRGGSVGRGGAYHSHILHSIPHQKNAIPTYSSIVSSEKQVKNENPATPVYHEKIVKEICNQLNITLDQYQKSNSSLYSFIPFIG